MYVYKIQLRKFHNNSAVLHKSDNKQKKSCFTNLIALYNDKWLDTQGESSGCCLPGLQWGFWHCPPWYPLRQAQKVQAGQVDGEVD